MPQDHVATGPAVATGAAGGVFSGLTGVGGGAIMVPLLTGVLKMGQHEAHAVSLFVILFAATAGAATYALGPGIDLGVSAALIPGALIGAYFGVRGAQRIPGLRLRQVFGVFLLFVAARFLLFTDLSPLFDAAGFEQAMLGSGIGLIGGFASGALGIGGGAIFVPSLVLVLGLEQHEAQGVSLLVILFASTTGAWTHWRYGTVNPRTALPIAIAAAPAGIVGALIAAALGGSTLQRVFAVVVLGVGIQMIVSAGRQLRRAEIVREEGVPTG